MGCQQEEVQELLGIGEVRRKNEIVPEILEFQDDKENLLSETTSVQPAIELGRMTEVPSQMEDHESTKNYNFAISDNDVGTENKPPAPGIFALL